MSVEGPSSVLVGQGIDVNVLIVRNGDTPVVGPVHIDFGTTADITIAAIDIDADRTSGVAHVTVAQTRKHGRIKIAATASTSGASALQGVGVLDLLVRGAAGSVDNSFGTNGVFTLIQTSAATGLVAVEGRVFIGGNVGANAAIVALTEEGALDFTFGAAGLFTASTGTLQTTSELVQSNTGNLFLGATVSGGTNTAGALIGATSDGVRLPNFGTSGVVTTPLQTADQIALAPALTGIAGQTILVAGRPDALNPNSSVVLLQPDGTLTTKYGSMSLDTISNDCTASDKSSCVATAIASSTDSTGFAYCAPRGDGTILSGRDLNDSPLFADVFTSLYADSCGALTVSKGFVYLAGELSFAPIIQRYGAAGASADWTTDALATASLNLEFATGIVAQADGTFAVAAKGAATGGEAFVACRLTAGGTLDTTFASPTGCAYQVVPSLQTIPATTIDPENRILMVGTVYTASTHQMVATRFWQ